MHDEETYYRFDYEFQLLHMQKHEIASVQEGLVMNAFWMNKMIADCVTLSSLVQFYLLYLGGHFQGRKGWKDEKG